MIRKSGHPLLRKAIIFLGELSLQKERNMAMPGDPRYQPKQLKPYLGYDNWAAWLIVIEWFWMLTLAKIGVMPKEDAKFLTKELLFDLLQKITTTMQDAVEKKKKHDIIALLILMRQHLPECLHKWLHYCATSYDIICTAYALQLRTVFTYAFWPALKENDILWRDMIKKHARTLQIGRTHLQHALAITIGFWLAYLHNRFVNCARNALKLSGQVPGKFTGAVGTSASQRALIKSRKGEEVLMEMLGLPVAEISTQVVQPEPIQRFYNELDLLSGAMANLGEDIRILQAPEYGEILTEGSTSSAMPHKLANPIFPENVSGMHVSVIAESLKTTLTLITNLQRDLRWSNVMRSFSAAAVFCFKQVLTTKTIFSSMKVNEKRCEQNFWISGYYTVAELLHLSLQTQGLPESHKLVHEDIVPDAKGFGGRLAKVIESYDPLGKFKAVAKAWEKVPDKIKFLIRHPEKYCGDAVLLAEKEAKNKL